MRNFITWYVSPYIIVVIESRRMRWVGHVAHMRMILNAWNILVGKPEGKKPLGRPRCRWEDNIRIDLRETGWEGVDCIHLAQNRDQWLVLAHKVINLRVP
jgi:hypothetical protein